MLPEILIGLSVLVTVGGTLVLFCWYIPREEKKSKEHFGSQHAWYHQTTLTAYRFGKPVYCCMTCERLKE